MANDMVLRPYYVAFVSGGKDSLYMIRYVLQHPLTYPLDAVVHLELEIDYPFIKNVVNYMESECQKYGVKFYRFKPSRTWAELYEEKGFPSRIIRWCNDEYKLDAARAMETFLNSHGFYSVRYIGYCVDEVDRYGKRNNKKEVYPLVEAGIYEGYILQWAMNQPIFNEYYKLFRRCGCMYCPMAPYKETAYIALKYPDVYKDIMDKARSTELSVEERLGKPISVWQGNAKYNTEYRKRRVTDYWLPKVVRELEQINKGKETP